MRINVLGWVHNPSTLTSKLSEYAKRAFDIVVSALGLALLAPFFCLIAFAIKRDTPGPVFYRGPRIGRGGRLFLILKFRTMYENKTSYAGPRVTAQGDTRITPLGQWLRNTKLNELPQLWNVLKGDMSLVGPRPEDPEFTKTWPRNVWNEVLSVRPGITSPASVQYVDEEKLLAGVDVSQVYLKELGPDKMRLDQLYVRYRSFWLDLDTVFWTLIAVIPRFNAYKPPENLLFFGPVAHLARRYINWFVLDTLVVFAAISFTSAVWRIYEPLNIGWPRAIIAALVFSLTFSVTGSLLGVNRIGWSRARFRDLFDLLPAWGIATILVLFGNLVMDSRTEAFPYGIMVGSSALALAGFVLMRYRSRVLLVFADWVAKYFPHTQAIRERVLIVGPEIAVQHISWLLDHPMNSRKFRVAGFIDDDLRSQGMRIYGSKVVGTTRDIISVVEKLDIGLIILADPDLFLKQNLYLLRLCQRTRAKVVVLPDIIEAISSLTKQTLKIPEPGETGALQNEWVCGRCLIRQAQTGELLRESD